MNQIYPFLGPGYSYIAEPPLLLHLFWVSKRTKMGQNSFFHTHDKDYRKLQPLGLMQGDQGDSFNLLREIIYIRDQSHSF
jgi:hypothetical protein